MQADHVWRLVRDLESELLDVKVRGVLWIGRLNQNIRTKMVRHFVRLTPPRKILKSLWRTHSCVPRSHPCERCETGTGRRHECRRGTQESSACATSHTE